MSSKTNRKKKKRPRLSLQEEFQQEAEARHSKLEYQARKALHKELKIVKSFECQRLVRKLKQSQNVESQLRKVKQTLLDTPLEICLFRLGIPQLSPQEESVKQPSLSQEDSQLVEKLLSHKRMVTAMEIWDSKVTEYRQWQLSRREIIAQDGMPQSMRTQSRRQAKNKTKQQQDDTTSSDLFVCLGGTSIDQDGAQQDLNYYGPANGNYSDEPRRKNRPGQRARKAKAMAMEARRQGRTWDSSINWRPKKQTKPNDNDGETNRTNQSRQSKPPQQPPPKAAEIASMGKTWKQDDKQHPSWAASQSKKEAIVEFKGTKITFD